MGINPSLQSRKVLIMQGVLELYGLLFQTQFPFIVVCVERNTRIGEREIFISVLKFFVREPTVSNLQRCYVTPALKRFALSFEF